MIDRKGKIGNECCGQVYCPLCMLKSRGLCYVCDKDDLNKLTRCDICHVVQNSFTILECMNTNCVTQVCGSCNNERLNKDMTFCSITCRLHAYIEFKWNTWLTKSKLKG